MEKGYHTRDDITMADLGLSLEDLQEQPLELFAREGARIDAIAMLATLPKRLVEIGYKRLNGQRLCEADEWYWMRHKRKLDCRRRGDQLSEWEKRRVAQLHNQGLSVSKIAKTMGRGRKTIDLCLVRAGLREAPPYLARETTV